MGEYPEERVVKALESTGLSPSKFDVEGIGRTLTGWLADSRELDRLVDSDPTANPVSFVPEWS